MDLKGYSGFILMTIIVPIFVMFITCFIVICCFGKCKSLRKTVMLNIMKGIVSKHEVNGKPTYVVCNRKLPSSIKSYFVVGSFIIITICVQCFLFFALIDITYECVNDSGIDCFVIKNDVKLQSGTFAYDEPPVNCSSISKDALVTCYRLTAFDAERTVIGASGGYLLFKLVNFAVILLIHIMLWVAEKHEELLNFFKLVFCLIIGALSCTLLIPAVELESRELPYTVLVQAVLSGIALLYFVVFIPWKEFDAETLYYAVASEKIMDSDSEDNSVYGII